MLMGDSFDLAKNEQEDAANEESDGITAETRLVPPLHVATRAIQSISIIIQNVSRATSLYVILSNNHINTMISLPLELYSVAERGRQVISQGSATPQTFTSPPMIEFTTHFVTSLKSLAMRMNTQTLQFYLKYPSESDLESDGRLVLSSHFSEHSSEGRLDDEDTNGQNDSVSQLRHMKLEFPLYELALELCAAHNDSFVRTTAMKICLNTLRLATVVDDSDDELEHDPLAAAGSLPDGTLHSAKALPFRERFAIAQFTCIPSRVERLIAPFAGKTKCHGLAPAHCGQEYYDLYRQKGGDHA